MVGPLWVYLAGCMYVTGYHITVLLALVLDSVGLEVGMGKFVLSASEVGPGGGSVGGSGPYCQALKVHVCIELFGHLSWNRDEHVVSICMVGVFVGLYSDSVFACKAFL